MEDGEKEKEIVDLQMQQNRNPDAKQKPDNAQPYAAMW
jgi:hypothetical protein